jgi:Arc/MetJ-type ribon-helix-helix transcriptional regulator
LKVNCLTNEGNCTWDWLALVIIVKENVKVTLRLPKEFIDEIDFLVEVEDFPSRSEAIRTAVRDLLYNRVDLVMGNIDKKIAMRKQIEEMEDIKRKYLQR